MQITVAMMFTFFRTLALSSIGDCVSTAAGDKSYCGSCLETQSGSITQLHQLQPVGLRQVNKVNLVYFSVIVM